MPKLPAKIFSYHPGAFIKQPFLAEIQSNSFNWFLKKGLKELLKEISPIKDTTGKEYELHFVDYYFDEPKYSEELSWSKELTFEAPLRAKVKLINNKTKETKEQEVYLGDFPMITSRGTFIINGVERVVVSQLIRSAGVYFTAEAYRGRKLFGAKVIPDRGSWLEFSTDPDGFIGVKIDRHRKVAVTDLIRVFASIAHRSELEKEEAILKLFNNIDNGPIKHIETTLKKSDSKSFLESYSEVYKRLRPGDLATSENAKHLIDAMFERSDRYSLSFAGRFKFNQRLGTKSESLLISLDDIIAITKEIIKLNNDLMAESDDIDHLGNRRVRAVGELLAGRMRVGFARLRRTVQDRMSTLETNLLTPVQLINARPLVAVVREFFTTSQLSQFMDQDNPLAELEHKRRLSSMGPGGLTREHAGFEVRDVHISHYGRICPIETPEGQNIGLINHLANFSRLNDFGFLETPYIKVKNGKATDEVVWFDAIEEEKYKIAQGSTKIENNGKIVEEIVGARHKGRPITCRREEAEFIDVAPYQMTSVATALIPFLEHDDANRALMGSNMQRQAVPSIKPSAPLVSTGIEDKAAFDCGRLVISENEGKVVELDSGKIVIEDSEKKKKAYELNKFRRSNDFTCISQRPVVNQGDKIKKGDILADSFSTDNGVLALGQNLLVSFVSWEGANFEDAIILSERIVKEDLFTSIHIEDFYCDVRDTKLGPEITTPDIPNISEEKLKNLDEEGIIRIGAEVGAGDILVGKVSPKGESEASAEERLLRAIFGEKARDIKDTSLVLPHGKSGRIIGIKIFSRDRGDKLEPGVIKRIQVEVAQLRKVRAGDKLAGRHGNKGVISQIRPIEDMPYLEDGTPVDIILNPLGVASRMNIGQILETHLGLAAKNLGYRAVSPVFVGATEQDIKSELKKAGYPQDGKLKLFDGRTGQPFPKPITVGYIYMLKLNHLVEDKIHMRSIGPYSLITQQPLGGKAQFGGQRFGEMEVWALEGYGAANILQEMLTIKSDDVIGRAASFESIIRNEKIKAPNIPAAFNVLMNEIKALGLDIETITVENKVKSKKD
ncbi:DNA-directed RNA polymerase subunit beta [Candidatus Wolfebacteria bacterium RIFCSPLOWO2_01_FULL_38_11]|uniref:DNA-directed RNA polymerase subunit beta n=2 Tax=Candidatus Wolfeibacteriota TaxID=1752735 RepID=A0A0G0FVN9_9BACT|nr:MAG: DNA-directed RNA polymerase subunit beta [Candidatus Wolfebacteria bacterium GW2011_GWC1_37_10]OGM90694.1 MAG: DNA-directed RNA polymerase subunit beta [Candidatus Wolfebacteria bacterium RIFCSPLOWO2_01_FULL_38_11]